MTGSATTWAESIRYLRDGRTLHRAQAVATLAESARAEWESLIVCRTSMQDLLFTNLDDAYPFNAEVRVSW